MKFGKPIMSTDSNVVTILNVKYSDYNHRQVLDLHIRMQRDFGKVNQRWRFRVVSNDEYWKNKVVKFEYWFQDARDATLFALKYSGEGFSIDQ
jgi:hypothetical protein